MKEFSQILRELRMRENLSQEALGNIIHVSRSSIAKYENGLGLPSQEVIHALCKYFNVTKDELFPKENVEKLITEKNIIINKQKKRNLIITLTLSLVIIILVSCIVLFNAKKDNRVVLDDATINISIEDVNFFQKEELLFEYEGGYVYQKIEIHKLEFTKSTNLCLIRVQNTYTNGHIAHMNDEKQFDEKEYTNKVYMGINFPTTKNNVRTIASWHQKHSICFSFFPQLKSDNEIIFNGKKDLFDGASITRIGDRFQFSYDCSITNWLFDYEYNSVLRKCTINNDYYNSNWEYEMLDDKSKKETFTISSSYLLEAKPNQSIDFEIETKMFNTNRHIQQKKQVKLYT